MHRTAFFLAFALAGAACGGDDSAGGGAGSTGTAGAMSPTSGGSGGTPSAGGAGGGGPGGSAMAGGAAGAAVGSGGMNGGTDGGSKCTVLNQNMCDTCVFAKCCDAYAACSMDDDCLNAIGNLAECVHNDPTMATQCYDDFGTTNAVATALGACVKMSCDADCKTVTP